jgi:chemotaxis protein CheC
MHELPNVAADVLAEIINIGVGRAAGSLNDLTGKHITLRVPEIKIVSIRELQHITNSVEPEDRSLVVQRFRGDFTGTAALFLPKESAVRLISAATDEEMHDGELDSIHTSTFVELGNIVLNAVLGSLSNTLGCEIDFSVPYFSTLEDDKELTPESNRSGEEPVVIIAETNFIIRELAVSGFIFIVFAIRSIEEFLGGVQRFVTVNDHEHE